MRLNDIQKAALLTIKYFDLFNYPPDHKQIHKYLYGQKTHIRQTNQALFELKKLGLIGKKSNYWFLSGKEQLVDQRLIRVKHSKKLRKKLLYIGWLFKLVPFARSVVISNNLAFNNASKTSDIDLLILTRENRLWTARFFATLIANLTGLRVMSREGDPGQLCLSFFISEDNMNLIGIDRDYQIFRSFWIALLDPLYDNGLFSKFLQANSWAIKNFPNLNKSWQKGERKPLSLLAFLGEKILNLIPGLEKRLYRFQKNKISKPKKESIKKEVVITTSVFKSHFDNHRQEVTKILKKYYKKIYN